MNCRIKIVDLRWQENWDLLNHLLERQPGFIPSASRFFLLCPSAGEKNPPENGRFFPIPQSWISWQYPRWFLQLRVRESRICGTEGMLRTCRTKRNRPAFPGLLFSGKQAEWMEVSSESPAKASRLIVKAPACPTRPAAHGCSRSKQNFIAGSVRIIIGLSTAGVSAPLKPVVFFISPMQSQH